MALTKGEPLAADDTKENAGDRCNTPTRPPPREQWRAAPELDELKEVIGTRAQVLAAIKLQARRHAVHGTYYTHTHLLCGRAAHPSLLEVALTLTLTLTLGVVAQAWGRCAALTHHGAAERRRRRQPSRHAHRIDPRGATAHGLGAAAAAAAHAEQRRPRRQPDQQ